MNDNPQDLTPEETARVAEIRLALEQELAEPRISSARTAIKDIEELKADALEALKHELKFGISPTLKCKVAMWAYEQIIEQVGKSADDPSAAFFKELAAAGEEGQAVDTTGTPEAE